MAQTTPDVGLSRVNALYDNVDLSRRADLVLLPAIAEMSDTPPAITSRIEAMLFSPQRPGWAAVEAWCLAESQQALKPALEQVVAETDYRFAFAFAQPYGESGIDAALIEAGLYSPLKVDGVAGSVSHDYLHGLDRLEMFVHLEATRLAAAGEAAAALDLLVDWAHVCRQMLDRAFWGEVSWGYNRAIFAMRRITDVTYTDWRGSRSLSGQDIADVLARLDDEGFLALDRLPLPRGDFFAAEAIAEELLPTTGAPDPAAFSLLLAQLQAGDRPLRLFGASGPLATASANHADRMTTVGALTRIKGELDQRWTAPLFSPLLGQQPELVQATSPRLAIPEIVLNRAGSVLNAESLREQLLTEFQGARHALAVVGYEVQYRVLPPDISSVRPAFLTSIRADPWNADRNRGRQPPMQYFVPVRDRRVSPGPHEFAFVTPFLDDQPTVSVGADGFVMYSLGPDNAKNFGRRMRVTRERTGDTDYLIWPPYLSVLRAELGG